MIDRLVDSRRPAARFGENARELVCLAARSIALISRLERKLCLRWPGKVMPVHVRVSIAVSHTPARVDRSACAAGRPSARTRKTAFIAEMRRRNRYARACAGTLKAHTRAENVLRLISSGTAHRIRLAALHLSQRAKNARGRARARKYPARSK